MKYHISYIERRVLAVLQEGLPRSESPYKEMAGQAGIETKQLLSVLENWKRQGKLRMERILKRLRRPLPG
jgi:DNA-binding Lrp family transcriptional regulator